MWHIHGFLNHGFNIARKGTEMYPIIWKAFYALLKKNQKCATELCPDEGGGGVEIFFSCITRRN